MRTAASLLGSVLLGLLATTAAAQVHVGPLAGASLLNHTDTSLSHGPLNDSAMVGRTWLVGGALDVVSGRSMLTGEFVFGPYHGDLDRYCIERVYPSGLVCEPEMGLVTSRAFVVDVRYARLLGRGPWRPYVGGGIGFKRYDFEGEHPRRDASTGAAVLATVGLRSSGRRPLRLEVAGLIVPHHPILNRKTQFELQARFVAFVF